MKIRNLSDNGDGTFSVPLTKGKAAVIDAEDAPLVARFNWHAYENGGHWYARRRAPLSQRDDRSAGFVTLHRQIMGDGGPLVDHRDGDGLNCRRSNMRHATKRQNQCNQKRRSDNTSGCKGVYRKGGRWAAQIGLNGRIRYIGSFLSIEDACRAYDEAARQDHGEFALTNGYFTKEGV